MADLKMNPSTYKQVRENMEKIGAAIDKVEDLDTHVQGIDAKVESIDTDISGIKTDVDNLEGRMDTAETDIDNVEEKVDDVIDTITGQGISIEDLATTVKELKVVIIDRPTGGDVMVDDNKMRILGLHVNSDNKDTDLKPSQYKHGYTAELKKASVIGLDDAEGVAKEYVFVVTLVQDERLSTETAVDASKFACIQFAYADAEAITYRRINNGDAWAEWVKQSGGDKSHTQWVQSDTEPVDQIEGDYWCEPIHEEAGE